MKPQTQLNSVLLRGIVGAVRVTNISETSVLKMTLATNFIYREESEVAIETTWHQVTAFESSRMPKSLFESLHKADHVEVRGRIRNVKYTDVDGLPHCNTEILATDIVKLEPGSAMQGEDSDGEGQNSQKFIVLPVSKVSEYDEDLSGDCLQEELTDSEARGILSASMTDGFELAGEYTLDELLAEYNGDIDEAFNSKDYYIYKVKSV